ncbi:MAG TPA: hypothetical protein P5096_02800 [Patescibacteria group bacterium]|nr:hypothetical protein [Patescibacteria group bacterium]
MNTKWYYAIICVFCITTGFVLNSQRHTIVILRDNVKVYKHDSDIIYNRLIKSERTMKVVVQTCREKYDFEKCGKMLEKAKSYLEERKNEGR